MNASLKLLIALVLSLEISVTKSISLNIILVAFSFVYVIWHRPSWKQFAYLFFIPLLPAFGSWSSLYLYGTGDHIHMAWVMFTRIFAYVWIGASLTMTTTTDDLLTSLEQNAKLPSTFVYGMLGAFNFIPRIGHELNTIKISARMRGEVLHFWSPQIFFKAILTSLNWSTNLSQAMTSHGFAEGAPRTHYQTIKIPSWNWPVSFVIIISSLAYLIFSPLR
ncbi:energy-coupling factor transporter transmembrane protein EcfT [Periweissella cryptocerci]|uniref:Energy-coupling factor transporter transmembrane protein EcfT n=1 Tax=Periweissella cryptocerci TaxID=2506420 RepID=A0A4P6YUL7_9LACO|nr:energy-coupling factor transporter transmembrane component T [Periweissella cryptocerci]QBO36416.1 energy-coupling factor transporter transmembrane protein EcfT [Periweissella cryptocerci]